MSNERERAKKRICSCRAGRIEITLIWSTVLVAVLLGIGCSRVTLSGSEIHRRESLPGVLRMAYPVEPVSLNPLPLEGATASDVTNLIYSGMWTYDDKGRLVPDLAVSIPTIANGGISPDGHTIVIHLRRGVTWQDGAPLTSHDVVFTFRAVRNPANIVPTREYWEPIAGVDSPDSHTLVFHLEHPAGTFLYALSSFITPILPAHLLESYSDLNHIPFNTRPVGSGPFQVVEWVHGDHITLRANQHYWRGPPKLQTIVLKVVSDSNTIVTELESGELDAWLRADRGKFPELRRLSGYRILTAPQIAFVTLDFNLRDPILADIQVRRAIAAAIDRQRLIRTIAFGLGHPVEADQPLQGWAYNPHVPRAAYEPTAARRLLDKAGWTIIGAHGIRSKRNQSLELQIAVSTTPSELSRVAALIQEQLRAVGIATFIKMYPRELISARAQYGGIMYSGHYQMAVSSWQNNDDPDDYSGYGCAQFAPAGQNWNFWCDRRADGAMRDALNTFDQKRRKRDYAIVQEEIAAQLPAFFLWQSDRVDVLSDRFRGYTPSFDPGGIWNAWNWSMK